MHKPRILMVILFVLLAAGLPFPLRPVLAAGVIVAPEEGPAGSLHDIVVTDLTPGQTFELRIYRFEFFAATAPSVLVTRTVVASGSGRIEATLDTTGLPDGTYVVTIKDQSGDQYGSTLFSVTPGTDQPSIAFQPSSGASGDSFTLTGENLGPNQQLVIRVGEAGGTPFLNRTTTTSGTGTINQVISTTGYTPGFLYYGAAYVAGENYPLLADKAYFALDGPQGQPPAFPRAFTDTFIGPVGGSFVFNLSGFDPGEQVSLRVAKDRVVTSPDQFQYITPPVERTAGQDGRLSYTWDSGQAPPDDYFLVVAKAAGVLGGTLSAVSDIRALAAFTIVTPPILIFDGETPYPLTVTTNGPGTVGIAPGGSPYAVGTVVTLTPQADSGAIFAGWQVDGQPAGWANPLAITMYGPHNVVATFANPVSFPDVPPGQPYSVPVAELSARGAIRGYEDGTYGPDNQTVRAQMAALIGRPMGYTDSPSNPFTDRCAPGDPGNCVDAELWNRVAQLASRTIARGYTDAATCGGPAAVPCYAPRDNVLHAQILSFITRAMVEAGYWTQQPIDPTLYGGVLNGSGHEQDIATFVHHTQDFGGVPDYPTTGSFPAWNQPSTRGWFARALWIALNSYWSVDHTP